MLGNLEGLIGEAMAEWQIPALAIAVVHERRPILLKAYGARDLEADLPATTDTQFAICSITKSFTATGIAMLVEDGSLDWDRPVRDYMPDLQLLDPAAAEITLRDMLTHRSGLPRHDWVWFPGDRSQEEMLAALRYLEPSRTFRAAFQYQNLVYMAVGILTDRVTGMSWEEFIRSRILRPLGMEQCTFSIDGLQMAADFARPYSLVNGLPRRAPLRPISTSAAGAINAPIAAMANYLCFHLDRGLAGGRRILSESSASLMQSPQIYCHADEQPEVGDVSYGFGFEVSHYRGEKLVRHAGGWIGWQSLLAMLPERGLGIVILSNRSQHPVPTLLAYAIFDRVCRWKELPWLARFRSNKDKSDDLQRKNREIRAALRKPGTQPSHPLPEYVGDYEHLGYGRISIESDARHLRWKGLGISVELNHRHFDIFEFPSEPANDTDAFIRLAGVSVSFGYDPEGDIDRFSIALEPLVPDAVFNRTQRLQPAILRSCVGAYEFGTKIAVVALEADTNLTLTLTGDPSVYHLLPYRGTKFILQERTGHRVEFRAEPSNCSGTRRQGVVPTVNALILYQPDGTCIATRMQPPVS
jgi:CubicO group peptidase (beta-lactamase class C family)